MAMNDEQKSHLNRIIEDTRHELTEKYIKGAKEHKTTLSVDYTTVQLVDMLIEEVLDLVTYAHTLREKIRESLEER